ncbi:MAG: phosphatidate cytidylyltransferase [Sphingobium sp.]|nr:phosphatidate cytidylyltransferase [Sphingobium sp.]
MAAAVRKSDLAIRTASAVVMLAVAGTALWMGGTVFTFFVALVAFLVVLEWRNIVVRFPDSEFAKGIWMAIGGIYAALGCAAVLMLHDKALFIPVLAAVIGTDIGAYFSGRLIGGPKIAPAISPSKTWAGLGGGMAGSALLFWLAMRYALDDGRYFEALPDLFIIIMGASIAVVAQAGDFFESWMKRRAGVKDSGALIPGHGGMFDRVDGLLAAAIFAFLISKAFSI